MRQVTIKALARELRLSVSTISKALRDSHEISEATKRRVLELAARLEYTPNPYASSLRGRKSRNIAIVIALLCATNAVHAQQGTITFVGQIVQETCVVVPSGNGSGDGPDFTVHLPDLSRRALDEAGKRGVAVPFHVVVGSSERPCPQPHV
ncbi:LacI family DNA-binding transcriptional regulator, partial [uncultured Chitinophaga sp.]|uniref:LacI family DNA-binding transcriptional regulator n=1 Tax=uncultured Chitinophaga sp. TaxID=339340 RepID=UPI0026147DC7